MITIGACGRRDTAAPIGELRICDSCDRAPRKLAEETNGSHIYMRLCLSGRIEEIDVYLKPDGNHRYITSADHCPENHPAGLRDEIIQAFHALY